MKTQSLFTQSLHESTDQFHFKFTKTILQKHKHSFSDLFENNQLEQHNNSKIRRKSCHCNECGRMSKFQFKFMNIKHQRPQNRNQSYTLHSSTLPWPKQNKFSIQLPNIQHIRKSQGSFRISRKQLLNEKSDEQRSPLMIYDSSFARSSISTTQKLLEDTALKNKPYRPSVFQSHDTPSPLILKSQQLITERLPKTQRSTNTKIKLRNNPKLLCPLLIGFTKKLLCFQKIKPSHIINHNRFKTS
ncbi:unnamed protein product [Paramecium sonneborni]|uniref:Uncharacterized protein n=1 Tax=Paramecium sonneborni TaxID=65129 RepID=A0A8S1LJN7_9CILI|nr:unnamed protein product [Paramecium sonneborni]